MREFGLNKGKMPYVIILVLGLLTFGNTLQNEYALDDGLLIVENEYVQQGFAGIRKIFTTSSADSYFEKMGAEEKVFTGGRYRPFSIATFAVEHAIFGESSWVRHLFNVLIYLATCLLLYWLLKDYLFAPYHPLAFWATVFFLIHPVHSEVVANVKSRDELLSLLFILACLLSLFKLVKQWTSKRVLLLLIFYWCALFSKEYGVILMVIAPVIFYVYKAHFKQVGKIFLILTGATVLYGAIRFYYIGFSGEEQTEILNNPYLYATLSEALATKVWVLLKYLWLLIFPYPLSADYSYNSIPYVNFAYWGFWISLLIYVVLTAIAGWLMKLKNPLVIPFLFFLGGLFFVSNIFLEIGSTMSCRLVYHASFGYVVVLSWLLFFVWKKMKNSGGYRLIGITISVIWGLGCIAYTIRRNAIWKNDTSLFINDVAIVPNSVLANGNAGQAYIKLSEQSKDKTEKRNLLNIAVNHLKKAIDIHPKFVQGYLNLGSAYFHLNEFEKMEEAWNKGRSLFPNHPNFKDSYDPVLTQTFYRLGLEEGTRKNFSKAIYYLKKALSYADNKADIYYHLGGAHYSSKDFSKAKTYWKECVKIAPNHKNAHQGLSALETMKN